LLFAACAQVVSPSGGKKDTTPPVILKCTPENKSINFTGKQIKIDFDEFVNLKDPNNQWVISPPLKKFPENKIKGKTLTISINETLKSNTTYNINFGKSIADVNESNTLVDFQYVFSTGTFVDSLTLSGNVINAYTKAAENGVTVMLYDTINCEPDSFVYKKTPDYFAFTDASGNYTIKYLKAGTYYAVALKDGNNNYLYDSHEENVAFMDSLLVIKANASASFKLFKQPESKIYIKAKNNYEYGVFNFMLNKPADQLKINPLHKIKNNEWAIIESNKTNDTTYIWLNDFSIDSLKLEIIANGVAIDTIEFPVQPREKFKSRMGSKTTAKTGAIFLPANGGDKDANLPFTIKFTKPIKQLFVDSMLLLQGKKPIKFALLRDTLSTRIYYLEAKLIADSSYHFIMNKNSILDCFGLPNDSLATLFKIPTNESLGNLFFKINFDSTANIVASPHYVFQLLNEKGDIIKQEKITGTSTFEYLEFKPGIYKARLIIDENNNGQWDTGNLLKKIQPEKVYYNTEPINLRANWDLEEEWKINF
jgi:hypothetical protein